LAQTLSEPLWQQWKRNATVLTRAGLLLGIGTLLLGLLLSPLLRIGPLSVLLAALGIVALFAAYWMPLALRARPLASRLLSAREIQDVSAAVPLTRAERIYVETLGELLGAAHVLGEPTARDLLPQLNELLENDRHLESQRLRAQAAIGIRTAPQLEAERADLARRAEAATDPVARQAMLQSLQLCDERLRSFRALEPHLVRIDAQRELISQTFASVQSALAGTQVQSLAPGAVIGEDLQQSVRQINQQTRAVEQAVQELMTLPPSAG
jgi:hypothetical protein